MYIKTIFCLSLFSLIFWIKSTEISSIDSKAKTDFNSAEFHKTKASQALNQYSQIYALSEGEGRAWYAYLKIGIDNLLSAAEYYFDALIKDSYNTMSIFHEAVSAFSRVDLYIEDLEGEDLDNAYERLLKLKSQMDEIKENTNKKHESNCEKNSNEKKSKKVS